jgi:hypothetical protein
MGYFRTEAGEWDLVLIRERRPAYDRRGNGKADSNANPFRLRDEEGFTDEEADELEDLAQRIGRRSAELHAAEQELLEWIAEFDRREGWKLHGHRNCTDWLAFWTGLDRRTARARVRVARALEKLPRTKRAMRRGRLSFSKVRAITRLGELEADDEATIVEFASKTTAVEVEKLVRRRRTLSRVEEGERERRRHATRTLAVFPDDAGMYEIRGRLDPEVGALVMRALEAAGDALYRVEREEPLGPEPPDAGQRRADALGLLAERALAAGFGTTDQSDESDEAESEERSSGENGPEGPRTADEGESAGEEPYRTDRLPPGPAGPPAAAVGDRAQASDCTCGGRPAPLMGTRAERYQVFLYLDPEALAREGDPAHTHLEDGTRLTADTVRRLTCDGAVVPVLASESGNGSQGGSREGTGNGTAGGGNSEDPARASTSGSGGSILDVGRRTRTIPPAIGRALRLRDGGCRFPGCGLRFAEGHHIKHWALGGPTSLDNLVSLCRAHHRAVHEDGFRVECRSDGEFVFFSPEGWPLGDGPCRVELEPGDPAVALIRQNRRRGIGPRWDAASADYAQQVHIPDSLLFRAWEAVEAGYVRRRKSWGAPDP